MARGHQQGFTIVTAQRPSCLLNIAVVPTLNPSFGGSLQYSLSLLDAAERLSETDREFAFSVFVRPQESSHIPRQCMHDRTHVYGSAADHLAASAKLLLGDGQLLALARSLRQMMRPARRIDPAGAESPNKLDACLRAHNIDWVLFSAPEVRCTQTRLPYVVPVFDLQHRYHPEFPEVSADGEASSREHLYRAIARDATMILTDSQVGREDFLECYSDHGVTEDRVRVLPYIPPPYLSQQIPPHGQEAARRKYRLPERYLFYPAQFWLHKNHLRLVQAIGLLAQRHRIRIHLVLSGTHRGKLRSRVFREVMQETERLGIADLIHYVGYVPNNVMACLYAGATGLVLPTFFGPTNIPVLEAWALGCPVLASDLRGIREQVGDAGVLVDPLSVESIASGALRLWADSGLCRDLAQRGHIRLSRFSAKEFRETLGTLAREVGDRVSGGAQRTDVQSFARGDR